MCAVHSAESETAYNMAASSADNNSALGASAARRLREALERIANGELDECPVCLEKPASTDARVLRCCQAVMCKDCIPSCKRTCPFCRMPFQERLALDEQFEEESRFTYTTQDYTEHTDFVVSNDYTIRRRDYSSSEYTANSYCARTNSYITRDYSVGNSTFTASSSSSYSAKDYSNTKDYSVPDDKYCAQSMDDKYSDIASKYTSGSNS